MNNEKIAASALIAGIHKRPGRSIRTMHGAPVADDASTVAKTVAAIHARPNFTGTSIDAPSLRLAVMKAAIGSPYQTTEQARAALEKHLGYAPTLDESSPTIRKAAEPASIQKLVANGDEPTPVLTESRAREGVEKFGPRTMLAFAKDLERAACAGTAPIEYGMSAAQAKATADQLRKVID